jgi:hypothetical protein
VEALGYIEGKRRVEIENRVSIAIDQIGGPAGEKKPASQAMTELNKAIEVQASIVARCHHRFEQRLNSDYP